MQCVVLAGGLGTRMWPKARSVPKTLLPVAGRPFAAWQLDWLSAAGVTSVVYCIGFLGEQIRSFVGTGDQWGLRVSYSDEGTALRGTAGALALAHDQGLLDPSFLVLYGDSWLQVDPKDVFLAAQETDCPALMTVYENHHRWDRSNVVFSRGLVTRYEKNADPPPPGMRYIDYGLSVLSSDVIREYVPSTGPADAADLYRTLSHEHQLAGYLVSDRFFEIGSPEGLVDLELMLRDAH